MAPNINLEYLREKRDRFVEPRAYQSSANDHRRGFRRYRVSRVGQMTLPAEARRRWMIELGGDVEVADLGAAVVVFPLGGSESLLNAWLNDASLKAEAQALLDASRDR